MPSQALPPHAVAALLEEYGVPQARAASVDTLENVAGAFDDMGVAPVVLKAGGLLHKSDAGGVVLGLRDARSTSTRCGSGASRTPTSKR